MDQATYERWWPLHLRAAMGEPLTFEERAAYEAGLKEVREEEKLKLDPTTLLQVKAERVALEKEMIQLREKRALLEAEIARLEALLSEHARELLQVKD